MKHVFIHVKHVHVRKINQILIETTKRNDYIQKKTKPIYKSYASTRTPETSTHQKQTSNAYAYKERMHC